MSGRAARRALLLACAAVLTNFFSSPAWPQGAVTSYEVRKGDGLFAISRKLQYPGVTVFQMLVGIHAANEDAFPGGNINSLREGQVLRIPGRDQIAAVAPAEAASRYRTLIAKAAAAPPAAVASIKPAPAVVAPPRPPGVRLERAEQVRRYNEGLALERRGDDKGALQAFLEAAESGYGLAQRKLGEIYDKGNSVVQHDYQAALKWYQKAREQGVEIPKPFVRSPR